MRVGLFLPLLAICSMTLLSNNVYAQPTVTAQPNNSQAQALHWPAPLAERFMIKCADFNQKLIPYCQCIYINLRKTFSYAQFEKLALANQFTQDRRYLDIRNACANNPATRF